MSGDSTPVVDCVVLNWNDPDRTLRCIKSLVVENLVGRVIIVDNESDGTLAGVIHDLRLIQVTVIEHPENRGFAAGVNPGLQLALDGTASAILCINNDAFLEPGALSSMFRELELNARIGMTAPRIEDLDGNVLSTGGRLRRWMTSTDDLGSGSPDYLTWACVLLDRRLLEHIGLLDERFFMYWEDVEFGDRVRRAGFTPTVVTDALARHEVSSSHARAGSKIQMYSTLGLVVLSRQLGGLTRLGSAYRVIGRILSAMFRGEWPEVRAHATGALLGLRSSGAAFETLAKRGLL